MFNFIYSQEAHQLLTYGASAIFIASIISYAFTRRMLSTVRFLIKLSIFLVIFLIFCKPLASKQTSANTIALIDSSKSMSDEDLQKCKNNLSNFPIKYFSKAVASTPEREDSSNIIDSILSSGANNIILCSDGFDTSDKNISLIKSKNIIVNPFRFEQTSKPSQFTFTRLPSHVKTGKTIIGSFGVLNAAGKQIQITNNGSVVLEKKLTQDSVSEVFNLKPSEKNEVVFNLSENSEVVDQRIHLLEQIPVEKLLILGSNDVENNSVKKLLLGTGYEIDLEPKESEISKYKAIILNNISAETLGESQIQKLKDYVAAGGGLLTLGGNKSYGLGNYHKSPINDLLPVSGIEPEKLIKRLNSAVMLVLDKSSSMRESSRLDYTKLAAEQVVKSLKNEDYLGIIGFDKTPFIAQEMGQLATIRSMAMESIQLLFPNGNTRLIPALDEARKQIKKSNAGIKHIIIVTDGELPDAVENAMGYNSLINNIKEDSVTISTFLISNDKSALLQSMATKTGGAFHQSSSVENLPNLFLSDLKRVVGDRTQKEAGNYEIKPIQLNATTITDYPKLLGFVETKVKPIATLELEIDGQPLLASWNYQKGKVLSFTSDLTARWTAPWLAWNNYQKFASDLIVSISNQKLEINNFDFSYKVTKDFLTISIETYQNLESVMKGSLILPDSSTESINFSQDEKGHYEARIANPAAGAYQLSLSSGSQKFTNTNFKIVEPQLVEKPKGINYAFLEELAQQTSGKMLNDTSEITSKKDLKDQTVEIRLLILIVLLLYLLNIYLRETKDS